MIYRQEHRLDEKDAADIVLRLTVEPKNEDACYYSDDTLYFDYPFPDGKVVEIECAGVGGWSDCDTNKSYAAGTLYDVYQNELDHIYGGDGESSFFTEWKFKDGDDIYIVELSH